MLLEREALRRRIAEAEAELRRRIDAAVGQIAARLRRLRARQRRLEEFRGKLDDVVQASCGAARAPRPRARPWAAACRPAAASRSTASGNERPSVIITKSKMLPFLPDEKSNHAIFWSLTKNEGVFSWLKGDSPFHSRPALRNFTRRPDDLRNRKPRAQLVQELRRESHGDSLG